MAEAALWGLIAASSLIVGAEVALRFNLTRRTVGLIMALGVGMLISSISFELVVPAAESAGVARTSLGLFVGAVVFFVGDWYIGRLGGNRRKSPGGSGEEDSGMGIVLGTVLDGIPESATLGMTLAAGGGVSVSLLAAIWISNFPEALGSTDNLSSSGMDTRRIRLMWWGIALLAAGAAAAGYFVVTKSSTATGAFVEAFAAGALLTMIADEMAPEAFERSGLLTGLATVLGFVLGFVLTGLE